MLKGAVLQNNMFPKVVLLAKNISEIMVVYKNDLNLPRKFMESLYFAPHFYEAMQTLSC